nr:BNR-4 repeat-containing protein [uncultured Sphingobacterium sp.]
MRFLILLYFIISNIDMVVAQNKQQLISMQGSSRATAYSFSNKIIETSDKVYTLTLDNIKNKYTLMVREYSKVQNKVISETIVDSSIKDNHGGGSIAIDSDGYLHIVYGPHVGPFLYRKSTKPYSINELSKPIKFGQNLTYPTLVIDKNDNLYLFGRYSPSDENWGIAFFKKSKNGDWSSYQKLVEPDYNPWGKKSKIKSNLLFSPYINTSTSVFIDANGSIHCAFRMYRYLPKNVKNTFADARNGVSYVVGYIYSNDKGNTWNAYNKKLVLPITPAQAERIVGVGRAEDANGLFEISNIVVDNKNNPIIGISSVEKSKTVFYIANRNNSTWKVNEITLPNRFLFSPSSIAYYNNELILAASSIERKKYHPARIWGHKDNNLAIMGINLKTMSVKLKLSGTSSTWFPSISTNAKFSPYIMYMQGHSSSEKNNVYLYKY